LKQRVRGVSEYFPQAWPAPKGRMKFWAWVPRALPSARMAQAFGLQSQGSTESRPTIFD
jgi:hypothetical protein